MTKSIYDFNDYRAYLATMFPTSGKSRGQRAKLAQALNCQNSFVSQVLTGRVHLSLEHAILASRFLAHSDVEEKFFILLIHKGKAGSKDLERHFLKQIQEIRERRQSIRERIVVSSELKGEDQVIYYSAWYFLAVHILIALPPYQTPTALAEHLHLSQRRIMEVLEFLVSRGLAIEEFGKFRIGTGRIHLGQGSPMLPRHHANWRVRAIESVDDPSEKDLHYSGVIGISEKDGRLLKSLLLTFIEQCESIVRTSKEDSAYCLLLDLFGV